MKISNLHKIFIEKKQQFTTDSRNIFADGLYFALKGERFDGNEFVDSALEKGASFAIIDNPKYKKNNQCILVDNVLKCLQDLANFHRKTLQTKIIGIAGSNGKTTTKELLKAVLESHYKTQATPGNFNNHIGVPISLLQIRPETDFAIIEMGANMPHEVKMLCQIVEPDFGLVTSIGKEHLEGFGSFEMIIETEGELYDFVAKNNGTIFVNSDDEILMNRASAYKNAIYYGSGALADCVGKFISANLFVHFQWETAQAALTAAPIVETQLLGKYNFTNLLASAAVGRYFSVPYDKINQALSNYIPSNNRSQLIKKDSNTIILDAYNANPASLKLAIENFAENVSSDQKILILGDMFELGESSKTEHQNLIDLIEFHDFQEIHLVGKLFAETKPNQKKRFSFYENVAELKSKNPLKNYQNAFLLLKASRGIGLEKYLLD